MKAGKFGNRVWQWATRLGWLLCLLTAGVLLVLPPVVHPDTASYVGHSPERGPLYPYLIGLFGGESGFYWLAKFQAAALIAACVFFAARIGRFLGLAPVWWSALFLVTALPGLKFASAILTEPLGYALLIAFWALFAEEVLLPRNRPSSWPAVLCALALLQRPQMLFLPIFYGLWLGYRLLARRERGTLATLTVLLVCLAGASLLRGLDNRFRHGTFSTPSSGGIHLISSLLYIAGPQDLESIGDGQAREFSRRSLSKAQALHLTRSHWDFSRDHFDMSLERLVFDVVRPTLAESLPSGLSRGEQAVGAERLATAAALPLLAHMPGRFLKLVARKFYDGEFFYYIAVAISGLLALAHSVRTGARRTRLLALTALHSWLSYGIILLVGMFAMRYILPSEAILLALVVGIGISFVSEADSAQDSVRQQ